jgi:hypothetical protein
MDEPVPQQEQPEVHSATPSEIWGQLSPDLQERVTTLLGRLAYKCALARHAKLSKDEEGDK